MKFLKVLAIVLAVFMTPVFLIMAAEAVTFVSAIWPVEGEDW